MKFIDEFIKALFPDYSVENSTENFQEFKASLKARQFQAADKDLLESKFNFIQERDSIHISVTFGESDPVTFNSGKIDFGGLIKELEQEAIHLDSEVISIVITINKSVKESSCTIYDFKCFVSTFSGYEVGQFFQIFSKLFELGHFFRLKIFGLKKAFYTSSICFEPLSEITKLQEISKRKE